MNLENKEKESINKTVGIIIQKIFDSPPSIIEEIKDKGKHNIVIKAQVNNNWYILRLQKNKQELESYKKEKWSSDEARKLGVPTPKILEIGVRGRYAFSLQEFIEGLQGTEIPHESKKIWFSLGQYAKTFNSIPAPDLEVVYKNIIRDLFSDDLYISKNIFSKKVSSQIQTRLEETLAWKFPPRLCHGNLHPSNIIFRPNEEVYLIDWGEATGNRTPFSELAEIYTWKNGKENISFFLEGYGLDKKEIKTMMRDIQTLVLLRLTSVIKRKIEKDNDWRQDESIQKISATLNNINDYQEDILFTRNL